MAWTIECYADGKLKQNHRAPIDLTREEILERFGLKTSRYIVIRYPEGRPDQAERIHNGIS
jgi:DNA modification methylase